MKSTLLALALALLTLGASYMPQRYTAVRIADNALFSRVDGRGMWCLVHIDSASRDTATVSGVRRTFGTCPGALGVAVVKDPALPPVRSVYDCAPSVPEGMLFLQSPDVVRVFVCPERGSWTVLARPAVQLIPPAPSPKQPGARAT